MGTSAPSLHSRSCSFYWRTRVVESNTYTHTHTHTRTSRSSDVSHGSAVAFADVCTLVLLTSRFSMRAGMFYIGCSQVCSRKDDWVFICFIQSLAVCIVSPAPGSFTRSNQHLRGHWEVFVTERIGCFFIGSSLTTNPTVYLRDCHVHCV